jgi:hypothetical protein
MRASIWLKKPPPIHTESIRINSVLKGVVLKWSQAIVRIVADRIGAIIARCERVVNSLAEEKREGSPSGTNNPVRNAYLEAYPPQGGWDSNLDY